MRGDRIEMPEAGPPPVPEAPPVPEPEEGTLDRPPGRAGREGTAEAVSRNPEMYRLPGDPPLGERDILRFERDRERFGRDISRAVSDTLSDGDWYIRRQAIRALPSLPEAERLRLAPAAAKAVSDDLTGDNLSARLE
ncbi:hypothetical protein JW899_00020, partial [Candidatus Uhrbacteria bacterium]|nr:hypothetical protein [Candidatus Uhrbacteria bacterium]